MQNKAVGVSGNLSMHGLPFGDITFTTLARTAHAGTREIYVENTEA